MSLKNFIFSRDFLKHFGLAIAIFVGILFVLLLWLNIYTRHGQTREVPYFIGSTLEEAEDLAQRHKFRLVVSDSVYTNLVPAGAIAEQNPVPGHMVKKHRKITITLNAFNPEMAVVPNLVGMSLRQAHSILTTAGFETGTRTFVPDISVDFVLKQMHNGVEIFAGDTLQMGAVIDLVLGNGLSSRRTNIPNLIGLNLNEAITAVISSRLNVGTYVYDNTVVNGIDSLVAFIYKQNPEYNEEATLQIGTGIYFWLTIDSLKLPVDTSLIIVTDTIPGFDPDFNTLPMSQL
jgi:eukaryotic-like serine/threonine-protein kinase